MRALNSFRPSAAVKGPLVLVSLCGLFLVAGCGSSDNPAPQTVTQTVTQAGPALSTSLSAPGPAVAPPAVATQPPTPAPTPSDPPGPAYPTAVAAADAATHIATAKSAAAGCQIGQLQDFTQGQHAAYFDRSVFCAYEGGYMLAVYVVQGTNGWYPYDAAGFQVAENPYLGEHGMSPLYVSSGCVNARAAPSPTAPVNRCLPTGTAIDIDGGPTYAGGYLWWHFAGEGWVRHEYASCQGDKFAPNTPHLILDIQC